MNEIADASPGQSIHADNVDRAAGAPPEAQDCWSNMSLLGGPLHRLGRRLGLVRGESNTVLLGLALGWPLWVVVVTVAYFVSGGTLDLIVPLFGVHARLLAVIPLFFVCESWLDPQVRAFVRSIVASGVVSESERPRLISHVERLTRSSASWLPDTACLAVAILVGIFADRLTEYGVTALYDPKVNFTGSMEVMKFFGLLVVRFTILRWVWRLGLWWRFLWQVSRLKLRLRAAHPDRMGGLGMLEIAHMQFLPLIAALALVESTTYAEGLLKGTIPFAALYPALTLAVMVSLAIAVTPLFFFTPELIASRKRDILEYSLLAAKYVGEFERRWLSGRPSEEPLLGTADLQSLADLSNSIRVAFDTHPVPFSLRLVIGVIAAAMAPLLPLLLFRYSFTDLAAKFLNQLVGL